MRLQATLVFALASYLATAAPLAGSTAETGIASIASPSTAAAPAFVPISRRGLGFFGGGGKAEEPQVQAGRTKYQVDKLNNNALNFITGLSAQQMDYLYSAFVQARFSDETEPQNEIADIHDLAVKKIHTINEWEFKNRENQNACVSRDDAQQIVNNLEELRAAINATPEETRYKYLIEMFERLNRAKNKEDILEWMD
ncbi:MAG: hypothetical protein M1829_001196 [Trizodia sp. TS-e1964]|nr:MAG: hypothetical protein M1829_001196 [Trizodia sp. TS-e1964]